MFDLEVKNVRHVLTFASGKFSKCNTHLIKVALISFISLS